MALTESRPGSELEHSHKKYVTSGNSLESFAPGPYGIEDSKNMALHSLMAAAAAAATGSSPGFSLGGTQSSMEHFMTGGANSVAQQDAALFFKAAALQAASLAAVQAQAQAASVSSSSNTTSASTTSSSSLSSLSSDGNTAVSLASLVPLVTHGPNLIDGQQSGRRSVDIDPRTETHSQVDTFKSDSTLSPPPSSQAEHSPPSMGRPTSISPPASALGHTTPLQKLQSLSPNTIIGEQFAAAAAAAGRSLKFSIDNILSPNFGTPMEQAARSMMLQAHYGAAVAAAAAAHQAQNPLLAFYQQMQQQMQEKYVSQQLALVNQSLQLQQQQQQQAALAAATAHFQQQQQQPPRSFANPFASAAAAAAAAGQPANHTTNPKHNFDMNAIHNNNNNNSLLGSRKSGPNHTTILPERKRKRSDSESSEISSISAQSKENPLASVQSPKMIKKEDSKHSSITKVEEPKSPTSVDNDSDKPLDEKIKQPMLWPAWVYCTRYSDRPSSGMFQKFLLFFNFSH